MKKFEYKVVPMSAKIVMNAKHFEEAAKEYEKELNRLGAEGWELIHREDGMFFLKREM